MRVIINRLAAAANPRTGVGHYTEQLVRHLAAAAERSAVSAFPGPAAWHALRAGLRLLPLWHHLRAGQGRFGLVRRLLAGPRVLGRHLARGSRAALGQYVRDTLSPRHFDLYHEPNFLPIDCDVPTAVTLHDLSVLLYPHWHPSARVARHEEAFASVPRRCVYFFTDSEYVRFQAIRLLNLPPEKVGTLYPGVRDGFRPLEPARVRAELRPLGLSPGYLLYVGAIEPRKNVRMLLEVYASLPAPLRERHPLVLAGPWAWQTQTVQAYYDDVARHHGVVHLGYVPERLLPTLYNGAHCLVWPSFYEGFGLPPVEMQACGGAVLASDVPTLRETIGDSAVLIDPLDADAWRAAISRALTDHDWLVPLRARAVASAARYTWQATAEQALTTYRRILGDGGHHAGTRGASGASNDGRRWADATGISRPAIVGSAGGARGVAA